MSREVVAFDFDDVLVHTAVHVLNTHNLHHGTDLGLADYYQDNFDQRWGAPKEVAVARVGEYLASDHCFELPPSSDAVQVIEAVERKSDLIVVTGRPDTLKDPTSRWLDRHFPGVFSRIIFSNFFGDRAGARSKGEICAELGVASLVDDHAGHINSAAEHDMEAILLDDFPWSREVELHPRAQRAGTWTELGELLLRGE